MATQVTLPAPLMRAIELLIADEKTSARDAYVGSVLISIGYGIYQQQEQIDPTEIAVPEEQWEQICQWLIDSRDAWSDITRVNYGLSWMNQGPSSYKKEAS